MADNNQINNTNAAPAAASKKKTVRIILIVLACLVVGVVALCAAFVGSVKSKISESNKAAYSRELNSIAENYLCAAKAVYADSDCNVTDVGTITISCDENGEVEIDADGISDATMELIAQNAGVSSEKDIFSDDVYVITIEPDASTGILSFHKNRQESAD